MKTSLPFLLLLGALSGCGASDRQIVDLPSSPSGAYHAEARVGSGRIVLHIARNGQSWSEYDWLALGQCSKASFYWSDERTAVFAYDKAELEYFVDEPSHWGGANVRICNRLTTTCPRPASAIAQIPGCDDHSM